MSKTMRLVRTHAKTGAVFVDGSIKKIRDAEQRVAWCATDNLGMARGMASSYAVAAGRAFTAGEPYDLGPFHFELTTEPTSPTPAPHTHPDTVRASEGAC